MFQLKLGLPFMSKNKNLCADAGTAVALE